MNEAYGHKYLVWDATRAEDLGMYHKALQEIQELPSNAFDTYDNPFERKCTLRDKATLPHYVRGCVKQLQTEVFNIAKESFGGWGQVQRDAHDHYLGIFRYEPGDHLSVHVDAGIHPKSKMRKAATAILYLGEGGGPLELWSGTSCVDESPCVFDCVRAIEPKHGRIVLFENNDFAWHGVPRVAGTATRVVITVSFLDDKVFRIENMRERAFFIQRPDESWTASTYELRDKRADSAQYAEAYRPDVVARM